jgi:hypothetical protein
MIVLPSIRQSMALKFPPTADEQLGQLTAAEDCICPMPMAAFSVSIGQLYDDDFGSRKSMSRKMAEIEKVASRRSGRSAAEARTNITERARGREGTMAVLLLDLVLLLNCKADGQPWLSGWTMAMAALGF